MQILVVSSFPVLLAWMRRSIAQLLVHQHALSDSVATDTHKTWQLNICSWTHVTAGQDNLDKSATYNPTCNYATGAGTQHLVTHDSISYCFATYHRHVSSPSLWFSIQKSTFRSLFYSDPNAE
jgi:hypothetical protein